MWSAHDAFLEHWRRYTLPGVGTGCNAPAGTASPATSQMRPAGTLANTILLAVCRMGTRLPSSPLDGMTAMAWGTAP